LHLFCLISCSFEEVTAFCDREEIADSTQSVRDSIKGACCAFSQQGLELGKGHFDGIEVRGIGRQEEEPRASCVDQFFGSLTFVEGDIVEDHDVAGRERRGELGFDPCFEDASVHRRIDDPGCCQTMTAQACDEGLGLPGAERCMGAVPLSPWRPSGSLCQFGVGRGLIDKDQPCQ